VVPASIPERMGAPADAWHGRAPRPVLGSPASAPADVATPGASVPLGGPPPPPMPGVPGRSQSVRHGRVLGRNWRGEEKEEDARGVLVFSGFDPRWHELVQVNWVPHKQKLTRWRAT
jgi:hypothetical protein